FPAAAFSISRPCGSAQTLHLDFRRPVIVLSRLESGDDARKFADVFFSSDWIATARGAEGAGKVCHRLGVRKTACARLQLHRIFPHPPLDPQPPPNHAPPIPPTPLLVVPA